MYILGIETSCDETACAVVKNGKEILSSVVASSLKDHTPYGGVIPEIASRRQLEFINAVVDQALKDSGLTLKKIDAIAVTEFPGLIGSLLVGVSFAKGLSLAAQKLYIPVDHIKSHLYANFLYFKGEEKPLPELPAIGLVISGGHTSLYHVKDFHHDKLLGQTRDDAVGEAFDKVAKILDLGYPGGPVIDKLAKTVTDSKINLKCAEIENSFDFSFSGVKTGVLYYKKDHEKDKNFSKGELAFAFQKSIVDIVVKKAIQACLHKKCKTLIVGGGVAANTCLRETLKEEAANKGIEVFFPPFKLCTDNAAMVAGLAYQIQNQKIK